MPIVEGCRIFTEACRRVSGLAKRARFVMSHRTGKIEIVGVDDQYIYMCEPVFAERSRQPSYRRSMPT